MKHFHILQLIKIKNSALALNELSKFHQHLINNQVKVDPIKEDNGHYYFHFYDPNGNKLQVHW